MLSSYGWLVALLCAPFGGSALTLIVAVGVYVLRTKTGPCGPPSSPRCTNTRPRLSGVRRLRCLKKCAAQSVHQSRPTVSAFGVTVNNLSPGLMATERNRWRRQASAAWRRSSGPRNPMGRAASPEEIAGAAFSARRRGASSPARIFTPPEEGICRPGAPGAVARCLRGVGSPGRSGGNGARAVRRQPSGPQRPARRGAAQRTPAP